MDKTVLTVTISLLLLPIVGGLEEYKAYGLFYTPSFGGGTYHYADGLVINGNTFDISGYSQNIPTQNLTLGVPSTITLKIFDNAGSYTIRTATLFFNIRGPSSSVSNSDTLIQYDLSGKTIIQDPHHFIGSAKGSVTYVDKFAYVSFTITPHSQMSTSNMIVSSTDERLATGYSLVVNAISFTNKTTGSSQSDVDYLHPHCTTTYPCQPVCGDHVCKPGEKPPSKP
ncbi:MAG: hypothetical protein KGI25_05545 [Thaumarchaeota archaeon]|nr:hypothetical protein [Nitrososphaerota archaeon]